MKTLKLILAILLLNIPAFSNSFVLMVGDEGEIRGKVTDKETATSIPFASVAVLMNNQIKTGTTCDENGNYKIKPLAPGTYDIVCQALNYHNDTIAHVVVSAGKATEVNITLVSNNLLPEFTKTEYIIPLIDKFNVSSATILDTKAIEQSAVGRGVVEQVATTAGVYQADAGKSINVRGSRSDATQYYVDGVKMIGGFSIPGSAIEEIQVLSGGIPAQYGDATGGIVIITTKSYRSH